MIYIMSDIHGNLRRFNNVLSKIELKPEDTLYVLGDAIDRHRYGIAILKQLMDMPNAKMLLGNHEYMMRNALDRDGNIPADFYKHKWDLLLWSQNGGDITHAALIEEDQGTRRKIMDFLWALPLEYDVHTNGLHYKLVHAAPPQWYAKWEKDYLDETEFAVWHRQDEVYTNTEDYTVIFGHTPTKYYQPGKPLRIWHGERAIGIDCGSGFIERHRYNKSTEGRLACLRLDDMAEFYSE